MLESKKHKVQPPFSLLAELTHRCPLQCPYCSNPIEMALMETELSTNDWLHVLSEAAEIGVVEVHFSGGEPLLRRDLVALIEHANSLEIYTNLITSGIGLNEEKASLLKEAGLANVQISFQAAEEELSNRIGGFNAFDMKRKAVEAVKRSGMHLSMNVVLHRLNIDTLDEIIMFAHEVGAERLELANTQFYNWALLNREQLLPSKEQIERASEIFEAAREQIGKEMEIIWVIPDYYESTPKPCMGGWGAVALTVAPNGDVLPCPTAGMIEGISFENVRERSLQQIWYASDSFNRFRGDEWLPETCRSCDMLHQDGGGCRCQAFALTGDAAATDPVCYLAPDHHIVEKAVQEANREPIKEVESLIYRKMK
ncbi:pyrroloquinoline quinone biosynthesis protein PqqE [Bacillus sp. JJ1533]|uniref:pyrroloquinoline quinone biosynthesis protein PqqE n=1 Tax=Bacillus sp. JJ1533 TaxID=3122959 RepID=UPI002FFD633A